MGIELIAKQLPMALEQPEFTCRKDDVKKIGHCADGTVAAIGGNLSWRIELKTDCATMAAATMDQFMGVHIRFRVEV